jgi:pimeloyl-ACP methyl ester carboxylesterase
MALRAKPPQSESIERLVHVPADGVTLEGALVVPVEARGVVLFAHGSGSSRHSPRNNYVARVLQAGALGTLLIDLLTEREDATYETRFDIDLLAHRLTATTEWLWEQPATQHLDMGYFGASTGAAAALRAAADVGSRIKAIVSRGGRPDMAESALDRVQAPTLLIVGGRDDVVIELNQRAFERLRGVKELVIVPGATHLFEEAGALEEVARLAARWFGRYLGSTPSGTR